MPKKFSIALLLGMAALGLGEIICLNTADVALSLYFVLSAFAMHWIKPDSNDVWIWLVACLVGPLADLLISHFGKWTFQNDRLLGIPLWLPWSWGWNALLFVKLGTLSQELLSNLQKNRKAE